MSPPPSAAASSARAPRLFCALAAVIAGAIACTRPADRAPSDAVECDDLPSLTPDEIRRPPYDVPLIKAVPAEPASPPPYAVLPDVTLSPEAAAKVARIDEAYARRTGGHLVVTSGTRDAARQAKAMFKVIQLGGEIVRLYRNKAAAQEIQDAHDRARGKPEEQVIAAMHAVLQGQIERGVFISAHLRAGAVDIRNRTMSPADKRAFVKSVIEAGGVSLLEEARPPHYHLQIE